MRWQGRISMIESFYSIDPMFALTVLGMTLATYALRAGGYWIMGRVPMTPKIRRGLEALPGAIIVSTVLPIAFKGGLTVVVCLIVAAAVMAWAGKEYIAVLFAVLAAVSLRAAGL